MNLRKTLVVLFILLGLLYYIWEFELQKQREEAQSERLFKNVTAEELGSISLYSAQGTPVTLVNKNPHKPGRLNEEEVTDSTDEITGKSSTPIEWQLKEYPEALLDAGRVNNVASAVAALASASVIPAKEVEGEGSVYGFTASPLAIEVAIPGREATKLIFGKKNEYLNKRYLKIEGKGDLYLVSEELFEAASMKRDDFRDLTPVGFSDDSVQRIVVQTSSETIEVVPDAERRWKISKPHAAPASPIAVYDLFRNLRNLRVEEFIDTPSADVAQYGLAAPSLVAIIERKDAPEVKVSFGAVGQARYFRINEAGPVYRTLTDALTTIGASPDVYREHQLLKFDTYFAQRVKIVRPGQTDLELRKLNDEWLVNEKKADTPFIRQYLTDLSNVRSETFLDSPGDHFQSPAMTISIELKEGGTTEIRTLIFGNQVSDARSSMVQGIDGAFTVPESVFDNLNAKEERFLPATPEATPTHAS